MSVLGLLKILKQRRIKLSLVDGKLRSEAPRGAITPELASQIKAQREALIDFLQRQQQNQDYQPIPRQQQRDSYPASSAQQRLWFIDQLEGDSRQYHITSILRLRGRLDSAALQQALNRISERHEALRTVFHGQNGDVQQQVQPATAVPLERLDLSGEAEAGREAAAQAAVKAHANRQFDLSCDQMLRGLLVCLDQQHHLLLITMHHIASDGWSRGIFIRELVALYRSYSSGETVELPALPIQYGDYAHWQRQQVQGENLTRQLEHWRQQLAAIPQLHSLPLDHPRPARQQFAGQRLRQRLSQELSEQLQQLASANDTTLFIVMQAAFAVLLGRWSNEDDIVVGTPIAGRSRKEVTNLIGFFVNTLIFRSRLDENLSFKQLLAHTRQQAVAAYQHQDIPFEALVEALNPPRSLSHAPLFQIMLSLQTPQSEDAAALTDLEIERVESDQVVTKYDLELHLGETASGLVCSWLYPQALFTAETIHRLHASFERLLKAIVSDPAQNIHQLDLLSAADVEQLQRWNRTSAPCQAGTNLAARISAMAAFRPAAIAVSAGAAELSYAELERRSNQLAHQLGAQGIGPDSLVGLSLRRGCDMVVAMLAVLKTGAAFVALDPSYPLPRLQMMIEDSGLQLLLCHEGLLAPGIAATAPLLALDQTDCSDWPLTPPQCPATAISAEQQLAYVIYTSGSTGRPKGVEIRHAALSALIDWAASAFTPAELARALASTSLNFDLSMFEIFVPLALGQQCVIVDDALALLESPVSVTLINTVPSAIKVLLDQGAIPPTVTAVNLAGEPLPAIIVNRLLSETNCEVVRNLYGPSEDTTYSTCAEFREALERPPGIGRPVSNTRAYVLSSSRQPVPLGAVGELYLAGAGLARGYRAQPQLTAERFITYPVAEDQLERVYRTGDLVRFLGDGSLEFIGRADDQLKIRGFRVEPGEIAFCLNRLATVHEALVLPREHAGERRLVAYVVASSSEMTEQSLIDSLRSELQQQLPDYMIPAAFVVLPAMPLTPNGKIDKQALPAADYGDERDYTPPATATEERLAALWSEVLQLATVGVTSSFFELGGHSLLATRVASAASAAFAVALPVRALFEHPTVRELAAHIDTLGAAEQQRIPLAGRDQPLPLSFSQQRIWFVEQLAADTHQYNMPLALRLHGQLDPAAVQQAVDAVVQRHEVLRTSYTDVDGDVVQLIAPASSLPVERHDWSGLAEQERDQRLQATIVEQARKRFDLSSGPVMRVSLIRLAEHDHALLLTLHHIAADGWSLALLSDEFGQAYHAAVSGSAPQWRELPLQYADYSAWQRQQIRGQRLHQLMEYWRQQLAAIPQVHSLPLDYPRPARQQFSAGVERQYFDRRQCQALRQLAASQQASLFMVLQAAFALLVARWSGQNDILIGTPVAGRDHSDLHGLIGCFINTLALRTDLSRDVPFSDLLATVRSTTLAAFAHQDIPFDYLVDELQPTRSLSHTPIVQLMLTMGNNQRARLELPGVTVTSLSGAGAAAKTDLEWSVVEDEQGLTISWYYATSLFNRSSIARLTSSFDRLLRSIIEAPQQHLSQLAWLPPADLHQLSQWHQFSGPYPSTAVHQWLSQHAAATPTAMALLDDHEQLTYAGLEQLTNQLAHALLAHGVRPGACIAVSMQRSAAMVIATVAVWKAGCTVVPLAADLPLERRLYILNDCAARLVLGMASTLADIVDPQWQTLACDALPLDAHADTEPATAAVAPGQIAYTIYTSGSTGRPKGVEVPHQALAVKYAAWESLYELKRVRRHLQMASFGFDVFMGDLCRAFGSGASLRICSRDTLLNPGALLDLIDDQQIEFACFVPAVLRALCHAAEQQQRQLESFKYLVVGGDVWTAADHRRVKALLNQSAALINTYGLTETGIDNTVFVERDGAAVVDETVPIGSALLNSHLHVLDAQLRPVPVGVIGELCIGGDGLAQSYLNQSALTAQRFIADPFRSDGARLYRTGDRVKWRADGQLVFMGRADQQVKIRGYRIEPAEIERQLNQLDDVREALVLVRGEGDDKRLLAYLTRTDAKAEAQPRRWREQLASVLPEYMIPTAFVTVDQWPLTANGKIDQAALPQPQLVAADEYRAPRNERERQLCAIWQKVLKRDRIGIDDNFFAIGGDSILSIQVVSQANQANLGISARQLFEHQTIAELAPLCGSEQQRRAVTQEVTGGLPLLPMQQRFFTLDDCDRHHDNQTLLLRVPADLTPALLRQLVGALYQRHDALRLRFDQQHDGWVAHHADYDNAMLDASVVSEALPDDEAERPGWIRQRSQHWQGSLDLTAGPLLRAVHFQGGDDSRLLLIVHHLLVDGVSWRILLSDLQLAWNQLQQGQDAQLAAKTSALQQWAEALHDYAGSAALAAERDYWLDQLRQPAAEWGTEESETAQPLRASTRQTQIRFDGESTRALLQHCHRPYRTTINELLLAGLYLGLRRWHGGQTYRIYLEGHGREELFETLDVSETVGWFTSLFPVVLNSKDAAPATVIKTVKEQYRAVPQQGVGYGILRYINHDQALIDAEGGPRQSLIFNYLGQVDQVADERADFAAVAEGKGPDISPRRQRQHRLGINARVAGGELVMVLDYSDQQYSEPRIIELCTAIQLGLNSVIEHCLDEAAGAYTPADFPLARVSQAQLDQWQNDYPGLQKLYPATPMQLGMLFHSLLDPALYVSQSYPTLVGPLDSDCFRRAWAWVEQRHDLYRTAFVGQDATVHQLVVSQACSEWHQEDWRELDPAEQERRFSRYRQHDRQRGFDLSRPPLQRLALFRVGDERYRLLWSHHHILLDGWSSAQIYRDVMVSYRAFAAGQEPQLPPPPSSESYLQWLQQQSTDAALAHWRQMLAACSEPTPLGLSDWDDVAAQEPGYAETDLSLAPATTAALKRLAQRHRTTVNVVLQWAWGYLLHRYSGHDEVVFGATIAGRPAEVPGIDQMLGLFINTIPVRVNYATGAELGEALQQLHDELQRGIDFGYLSLAEIQRQSGMAGGNALFDSLLVFENYPLDALDRAGAGLSELRIEANGTVEETNYALTLSAHLTNQLRLRLGYWRQRFSAATADRIMAHLQALLEQLAEQTAPARLTILNPVEQQQLQQWEQPQDNLSAPWPLVHQRIVEQAQACELDTAVIYADEEGGYHELSYGELLQRANQLAHWLQDQGIGPEQRVAVCLPRDALMPICSLAVWLAGGVLVPLDPELPLKRRRFMLQDSGARLLLAQVADGEALATGICPLAELKALSLSAVDGPPQSLLDPANAAYVIYTSGSTGQPKGVVVPHAALQLKMASWNACFDLDRLGVHLQMASMGFDVYIGDLVRALAFGGSLLICQREVLLDASRLLALIERYQVAFGDFVPAVLRGLVDHLSAQGRRLDSLRYLIVGSDLWTWDNHRQTRAVLGPQTQLINAYGLTEAGIDSSCFIDRGQGAGVEASVPVGQPLAGCPVVILDAAGHRLPPAAPGELYLGGHGLARAYLNRPALTAERFVPDPYSDIPGSRMYRSGDRLRWRSDGQLQFLGRVDNQIKIRGFRIEPDEVEVALQSLADVGRAAVVVDGSGATTRLLAYVVAADPQGGLSGQQVLTQLAAQLPEYMVPAACVVLEQLPLNNNGKIDRQALPAVERGSDQEYVAPRHANERLLAEIWQRVLGIQRVGVSDNFFTLGGDSILSIQVVTQANQAGLGLSVQQLFEHPTIAALAPLCGRQRRIEAPQGAVSGSMPLLPIQQQLLASADDVHHFNQSLLVQLPAGVGRAQLAPALAALFERHDALRLTFNADPAAPSGWRADFKPLQPAWLEQALISEPLPEAEQWKQRCQHWQASFDLASGPLLRAVHFVACPGAADGDRLLLIAHHLVVDGVSWRILLADLQQALEQLEAGKTVQLGEKSSSYQQWAQALREYADSDALAAQRSYWLRQLAADGIPAALAAHTQPAAYRSTGQQQLILKQTTTTALLQDCCTAYHLQINELLLVAVYLGMRRWCVCQNLRIDLEGHGREALFEQLDVGATVGWFTTLFPLRLSCASDDLHAAVKAIKEQYRSLPQRGIGYGVLRYLAKDEALGEADSGCSPLLFNYLGRFDQVAGDDAGLEVNTGGSGAEVAADLPRLQCLGLNARIVAGELSLVLDYSQDQFDAAAMNELLQALEQVLKLMVDDCSQLQRATLTPSDFPLARVSQRQLDQWQQTYPLLEQLYLATPMQQGLLFHSLLDQQMYVLQSDPVITGPLDSASFRAAWQAVIARHVMLRSAFVGDEEMLHQVVVRQAELPWDEQDWREYDAVEQQARYADYKAADRARAFDLTQPPLMRVALLRLSDQRYQLLWTHHHLLMDGWSTPQIYRDVLTAYRAAVDQQQAELTAAPDYTAYCRWLQNQPHEAALAYWRQQLSTIAAPTALGVERLPDAAGEGHAEQSLILDDAATAALRGMAQQHRTTINTLIQLAWAWLLHRYSGDREVLFGAVISGRPAEVPRIDEMVGLFINSVPVLVSFDDDVLEHQLSRLHQTMQQAQEHGYVALNEIQRQTAVAAGTSLFDSLLVFENYPLQAALEAASAATELSVSGGGGSEQTNYKLTMIVGANEQLHMHCGYRREDFSAATIERLLGHLRQILLALPECQRLSEVDLLSPDEHCHMARWNDTRVESSSDQHLYALFAGQARQHPQRPAVSDAHQRWTYAELEGRVTQLAQALQAQGVVTGQLVGLCLPRTTELIAAMLAILKSGAAYIPFDPAYPAARLDYLRRDSGVSTILTNQQLATRHGFAKKQCLLIDDLEQTLSAAGQQASTPASGSGDDLAYVLYTSGSTGQPKGVQIRHRNALAMIHWAAQTYGADELHCVLASTSLNFDLSVFEIFVPLTQGYHCHLVEDAFELIERQPAVTLINTVPSAIRALLEQNAIPESTQVVNLAGEPLPGALVNRLLSETACRRVFNLYGPSEDTTYSTYACFDQLLDSKPPIGRPLSNTQAHVLDQEQRLLPVGVPGELYLSGAGVAAGYLNRPQLTAERFVELALPGQPPVRAYRTGDRVRYWPDGQLEFLGRLDDQVKIRGFRIEPGEIEAQIECHEDLREAVVIARQADHAWQLVAYVVPRHEPQDTATFSTSLRQYLLTVLPEHLVPAWIVVLAELPLTPNGKIDKQALPEPDQSLADGPRYRQPRTAVERQLCAIWAAVLGRERVGIDDNFFALGGDSILAIQVVARARQLGLGVSARLLFDHQTVALLAAHATTDTLTEVAQESVTGQLILLPIQQRFFDGEAVDRHHYNQSLLLSVPAEMELDQLQRVIRLLHERHDALRLRFHQSNGEWQAIHQPLDEAMVRESCVHELLDDSDWQAQLKSRCNHWQASLDLTAGPLMRAVHFSSVAGHSRLFLVIHHLLVDGVSWRILLNDLQQAYRQLTAGENPVLAAKTHSLQQWSQALSAYAQSDALQAQAPFWRQQALTPVCELPLDYPAAVACFDSTRRREIRLDAERTGVLLNDAGSAYRIRIHELLLIALYEALRQWCGGRQFRIDLESHGREELFPELSVAETVGWFTSLYPVVLSSDDDDLAAIIQTLKQQLRQVPDNGIGYGLLRYLSGDRQLAGQAGNAALVFNYLGQFDQVLDDHGKISGASENSGMDVSPRRRREHRLGLSGMVAGGELVLHLDYSQQQYEEVTIQHLATCIENSLHQLITHCLSATPQAMQVTDFPLAQVEQAQFDRWQQDYPNLLQLYPATPMQRGMLFHSLIDPGLYVTQTYPVLGGDLDSRAFRRAWQQVIGRHDVFRTVFVGSADQAHQVVLENAELPWHEEDWRSYSQTEQQRRFTAYRQAERERGFDLSRAPLMRVALFRVAEDRYQLLWSHHHLLTDGWSTPQVYRDVMRAYLYETGVASSAPDQWPAPPPFVNYMTWLSRQSAIAATAYWQRQLGDVESPTPLAIDRLPVDDSQQAYASDDLRLSVDASQQLQTLARRSHTTINTIVQLAWAYLLKRYSGESQVVFGATISGRPAEVEGIEDMVGMFINTIPICLRLDEDMSLPEQLQQVQQTLQGGLEHGYLSLTDIQAQSRVPGGHSLFDSVLIFENYPLDAMLDAASVQSDLQVISAASSEQTNYPITLSIDAGHQLTVTCAYWRHQFTATTISRLLGHLQQILQQLPGADCLAGIKLLNPAEQQQLTTWNQTQVDYDHTRLLHHEFVKQAATRPDATALANANGVMSYAQLDQYSDCCASLLQRQGVKPGDTVALYFQRSFEMVAAIIGVLKAGAACLPVLPGAPVERLRFMLSDAGVGVMLSNAAATLDQESLPATISVIDCDLERLPELDVNNLKLPAQDSSAQAYVLYTSGSTGQPKGVRLSHRNLVHHLAGKQRLMAFDSSSVMLQNISYTFDPSIYELFSPLSAGGRVVLPSQTDSMDMSALPSLIERYQVDSASFTPTQLGALLSVSGAAPLQSLRRLVVGGEVFPPKLKQQLLKSLKATVYNVYGPTECAIEATWCCLNQVTDTAVPIGQAYDNVRLYVVDERRRPVPLGVDGELYIAGDGVALGYLKRPQEEAAAFIEWSADDGVAELVYRTGDLVYRREDGQLVFSGRRDGQVKLRGFRIEVAEIERQLERLPGVREAAVMVHPEQGDNRQLVACVCGGNNDSSDQQAWLQTLRQQLSKVLPHYMVPTAFASLQQLPVTSNGKVDYSRLRQLHYTTLEVQVAPATDSERLLSEIWCELLGREQVSVVADFFELGGHSLLITRMTNRISESFTIDVPLTELFKMRTIRLLAAYVDEQRKQQQLKQAVSFDANDDASEVIEI